MGVIHKLKPEIVDYIIKQKESNPKLGCRKIAPLVRKKFGIDVSKSSINSVLKGQASAQIQPANTSAKTDDFVVFAGAFFLLGADHLLGASMAVAEAAQSENPNKNPIILQKFTQALVLMRLLGMNDPQELKEYLDSSLWHVVGLNYTHKTPSEIISYYKTLKDKDAYYNLAMRLVCVYTNIAGFDAELSQNDHIDSELDTMLLNLHKYVKQYFFPYVYQTLELAQARDRIYSIPGNLIEKKDEIQLKLSAEIPLNYQMDIAYAINSFNKAKITNQQNKLLLINPLI